MAVSEEHRFALAGKLVSIADDLRIDSHLLARAVGCNDETIERYREGFSVRNQKTHVMRIEKVVDHLACFQARAEGDQARKWLGSIDPILLDRLIRQSLLEGDPKILSTSPPRPIDEPTTEVPSSSWAWITVAASAAAGVALTAAALIFKRGKP